MFKTLLLSFLGLILLLAVVSYVQGRLSVLGRASVDSYTWFVALKHNGDGQQPLRPAAGVNLRWQARSLGVFIGEAPAYWDEFALLGSDELASLPLVLDSHYQDAYVARLDKDPVPLVLIGALSLLHRAGVLTEPPGELIEDVATSGFRPDISPTNASIKALRAEPAHFRPAMINFLEYFDTARYPAEEGRTPGTGADAYLRYGRVAIRTAYSIGANLVISGQVAEVVVPSAGGFPTPDGATPNWHSIAIMHYPSPPAILALEKFEPYRQAVAHRNAGLARTRIISSLPTPQQGESAS